MNKKALGGVLAAIVVLGLVVAVGLLRRQPSAPEQVTVGAILPISGEIGYLGQGDRDALLLFADQHPNFQFRIEDSKGEPKEGLTALTRLQAESVSFYITSLSYVVNTLQPTLDSSRMLNLTLNMDPRSEEASRYCMRLYVTFYQEMDKLVELAKEQQAKRVAVLYVNVETMNNAVEKYLRSQLDPLGIKLTAASYELGTKDFRTLIAKVNADKPDIVRIIDFGDKLSTVLKQIDEVKAFQQATLVSGVESLVTDLSGFSAAIADRFRFTTPRLLLEEGNEVVAAYRQKYGSEPNFDSMFCYDIALLLSKAVEQHQGTDVEGVIDTILGMGSFDGAAAHYTIDANGGITPEVFWATVKDGTIEFLDPAPAAGQPE